AGCPGSAARAAASARRVSLSALRFGGGECRGGTRLSAGATLLEASAATVEQHRDDPVEIVVEGGDHQGILSLIEMGGSEAQATMTCRVERQRDLPRRVAGLAGGMRPMWPQAGAQASPCSRAAHR